MKIRDQIQETDFIFVLAEGKVTVQTKDLKGLREPEWKETLQMHQLGEKLQLELVPCHSSKNPITRPKPGFVSSAIHRTTCFKAH